MSVNYSFTYNTAPVDFKSLDNSQKTLKALFDNFDASGTGIIEHGESNTGGFFTNGVNTGLAGDTYAGSSNGGGYAYSITADAGSSLTYNFQQHVVYGTVKSITIGAGVDSQGHVIDELLTLTFDEPITGTLEEGRANDVHDIVWGLMNSSTTGADSSTSTSQGGLQQYLTDIGIDLSSTADNYLAADSSGTLPETVAADQVALAA
ncbi:hypothetical protein [Acinetobacter sp. WZC-1]|uniref:hypothetical protein n=1 Tax=Acinetobacter sp. WZC-1 TaxID=3459034 RepID=UPI00403DD273